MGVGTENCEAELIEASCAGYLSKSEIKMIWH